MVMSIRHFAEFLPPAGPPPQPVPTNLALNSLGVTALASSVYSGGPSYYALNAYDADDSSANRWNSDITIPVGEWLGVDLGSSKLISKFRVFQFTAGTYTFASDFKIQSADNAAFTNNLVDRYTYTGAGRGNGSTGFGQQDTGVVDLGTPAEARYWRVLCTTSSGPSTNGWGIYTFELHGVAGTAIPSQDVTLPFLSDADSLFGPTLVVDGVIQLPFLSDADSLFGPTLIPATFIQLPFLDDPDVVFDTAMRVDPEITLPLLVDADSMFAPTVLPDQAIQLPLLDDPDQLFDPSLAFPVQGITLPLLVDADVMPGFTVQPGAVILFLPFLDDTDTIFTPSVTPGPVDLLLPFLDDDDIILNQVLLGGGLATHVRVFHRYWGDNDLAGQPAYFRGQSIEVVGVYLNPDEVAFDPDSCTVEVEAPDGTEILYVYGVDADLDHIDHGTFRMRVVADQSGKWRFRFSGLSAAGRSVPSVEGTFRVRRTTFGS